MEFGEKLRLLRKSKGLTQEELAEALFVSRTAVSKWESGRGYPGIDSLREVAAYFSVTIDELLSGEKLLNIAERENRDNILRVCRRLFGVVDLFSFLMIILPLYPRTVGGHVYSVNLPAYGETTALNLAVYWALFLALTLFGAAEILLARRLSGKVHKIVNGLSLALGAGAVLYLALAREAYAVALAFLLLVIKGLLLFRSAQAERNR